MIDARGVIITTTFRDELRFDRSDYSGFGETLTRMRLGGGFVSDRIVQKKANGSLRKYACRPTPDPRYLSEIGLNDEQFQIRSQLKTPPYLGELRACTPSLGNVTIHNVLVRPIGESQGTVLVHATSLGASIEPRSIPEFVDTANATLHRYVFVDLLDPVYASDPSLVLEIAYLTRPLDDALLVLDFEHLLITVLAVVLGGLFAIGVAAVVTRPVRGLVEDIDRVAGGDLDHPLSDAASAEFGVLRESIDRMVARLREQLGVVRPSEQRVREQNEALERRVHEWTRELDEANQEAHLYIDIMTHDLGRVLGPARPAGASGSTPPTAAAIATGDAAPPRSASFSGARVAAPDARHPPPSRAVRR